METDPDLEAGANADDRTAEIRKHFGWLLDLYKHQMNRSDFFLEERLAELDPNDFNALVADKPQENRGLFGLGGGNKEELLCFMDKLCRIQGKNEEVARNNAEVARNSESQIRQQYNALRKANRWSSCSATAYCVCGTYLFALYTYYFFQCS